MGGSNLFYQSVGQPCCLHGDQLQASRSLQLLDRLKLVALGH